MKKFIALATLFISFTVSACWYNFYNYEDYIFGVNNFERHSDVEFVTEDGKTTTRYNVKNNMVVDFPISVSMKLTSDSTVNNVDKPEIIYTALQYRVLPDGEWITVAEHDFNAGQIPLDAAPSFYLGRNNINPLNCKKDDVIMIRLYATDGQWQSGDLSDMCDKKLGHFEGNRRKDLLTLQDSYEYTLATQDIYNYDLGGNWLPHLVTTVIFSGNYRPVR